MFDSVGSKSNRVWLLHMRKKANSQATDHTVPHHWDVVSLNSGGPCRRSVLIYPSTVNFSGIWSLVGDPELRYGADTGLIEVWWVCFTAEHLLMVLCLLCTVLGLLTYSALSNVTEIWYRQSEKLNHCESWNTLQYYRTTSATKLLIVILALFHCH